MLTDALVVGSFEDAPNELLTGRLEADEFEGKKLESITFHKPNGLKAKHLIVIGLGKRTDLKPPLVRQAIAQGVQEAKKVKAKTIATPVNGAPERGISVELAAQMLTEGILLGSYTFDRYKTVDKEKRAKQQVTQAILFNPEASNLADIEQGLAKGEAIATVILNARDIINEPPSKIKPSHLVKAAEEIAGLSRHVSVSVLDENKLKKEGYNALLAVAAGSEEKPYLIHLHYRPVKTQKSVAFVGKGVTFDSGGLGIKPWNAMLSMKTDMAGAANVLGIFQALAELENIKKPLNVEVHGVIVATENMISGKALRPDDIIETKSGKTIEVLHTDAEGRLILSDALTFAGLLKPDYMVDFATLTGAAIAALGRDYAAYMGNNQELLELVKTAAAETGELAWELPLPEVYKRYLESPVADLQNVTPNKNAPGAIFGGLFLQEFVGQTPWVHLDIAGPSFEEEGTNPVYPKGATGYGILLGLMLLENLKD